MWGRVEKAGKCELSEIPTFLQIRAERQSRQDETLQYRLTTDRQMDVQICHKTSVTAEGQKDTTN